MVFIFAGIALFVFVIIILSFTNPQSNNKNENSNNNFNRTINSYDEDDYSLETPTVIDPGEPEVIRYLSKIKDCVLFNHVCFKVGKKSSCEIDYILLTKIGIFIIEYKDWHGYISGSDEDEFWEYKTFSDYDCVRDKRRSPVLQNEQHKRALIERLNLDDVCYNVVLFPYNCDLSELSSEYTYKIDDFVDVMDEWLNNEEEIFSYTQINELKIKINNIKNEVSYDEHLNNIYNRNN